MPAQRMEADWEFEIGWDAPVIDAAWAGLIDLRSEPARVHEIAETAQLPGLADALRRLNVPGSPVWTAKCDVWEPAEFDPNEMEADPASTKEAIACYLDLLPRSDQQWNSPEASGKWCDRRVQILRTIPAPNCRADLVIRRAWITPEVHDLGVTAYLTACGSDRASARQALTAALAAFVDAVAPESTACKQAYKYNESKAGE